MLPASFYSIQHLLALSARNLLRQYRRTLMALAIVSGGVIAFMLASGFINWIFDDMRESTIHSQLGHVQITRPGYFHEGLGDPYRYLLPDDSSVIGDALGQGVETVTPRLAFSGLLSKDDTTLSFIGEGISPSGEAAIARAITIVAGQDLRNSPPDSALLGEGLAANLDAAPGDRIVLLVTTASGGINAVELTVAGLFATITKAYDDSVLRVPIDIARQLMRVDGATSWVVLLDNTEHTAAATALLQQKLSGAEYEIIPWTELADFYNKTVELFSRQIGVVQLLIALIVILSISNTLSMTVAERTGEIGTAMALGVRRRQILQLFLTEGALLGLVSGVLGLVLGHLLAQLISTIGIPMPPPPGMARGYIGQISISSRISIEAFLLAFLTTLIASLLPAWRASRMIIVDALRHQR